MPALVDQQRLGVRRDLLRLGEDRLHGPGVLLAADDLSRQGQHQIIAVVPVGGEAVRRQLTLDGEGACSFFATSWRGVGLGASSGRP